MRATEAQHPGGATAGRSAGPKSLLRRTLPWLPRALRCALVRRQARYDEGLLEDYTVEVAADTESYESAFELTHDAYVDRGWIKPRDHGHWVTSHHLFAESNVLVCRQAHGTCVGAVTVIQDGSAGLPVDETFPAELRAIRQPGRRLGEIGALALSPHHRRSGAALILLTSAFRYGLHVLDLTDWIFVVDRHIAPYYEDLFGAKTVATGDYLGFGAESRAQEEDPVALLHLDIETVQKICYPDPPAGTFNAASLAFAAWPAPYEQAPPQDLDQRQFARWKLSREVFAALFVRRDRLKLLKPRELAHLERQRSRETLRGVTRAALRARARGACRRRSAIPQADVA